MFHHDPSRTDEQVWALRDELVDANDIKVEVATEGDVVQL